MIDQTASAYSWSIERIVKCTLYQLKELGKASAKRVGEDRQIRLNMLRVAANADRPFFERYCDSLMPDTGERYEMSRESDMVIPESMIYSKGS